MGVARFPLDPAIIGADIGNATTSLVTGGKVVAFFPSVISTSGVRAYEGLSKIAGTTRHHITYKDKHALIGADAMELGGATILKETGAPHDRYIEPVSLLCLLAGVSAAFPDADQLAIRLATGAPISLYEAHGESIAAFYRGAHEYIYNGHRRRLDIEEVCVYGEGREALRLLPPARRRGNIAVHDLGGKTWNVLLFKDGALKTSRTFPFGTERLLDDISRHVSKEPAERWEFQAELRRNPKAHPKARAALEAAIAERLDEIEQKVALPKAEQHAAMGGGAIYLPGVLKQRYKVPAAMLNGDTPEATNALAYALAMAGKEVLA